MEFFLALLSHHQTPVKVEVHRLPLLAGKPATPAQVQEQLLFQWLAEYQAGHHWAFPSDNAHHITWGNSWVHVDDVVNLMKARQESGKRFQIVQPVSGHLSYVALDGFFRAQYKIPATTAF